ncbi:MAG: hypothetical protein ACYSRR_00665 [Planctomycetota bacterium]|jgi:hypothetical protein
MKNLFQFRMVVFLIATLSVLAITNFFWHKETPLNHNQITIVKQPETDAGASLSETHQQQKKDVYKVDGIKQGSKTKLVRLNMPNEKMQKMVSFNSVSKRLAMIKPMKLEKHRQRIHSLYPMSPYTQKAKLLKKSHAITNRPLIHLRDTLTSTKETKRPKYPERLKLPKVFLDHSNLSDYKKGQTK